MDDLHAQLMDDEKVLWEGHPDKKAFVLTHWFGSGLIFVIVWTLFTAAFVGTMFASGMTLDDMPFPKIIPIGFIILWMTPVWSHIFSGFASFFTYKSYYYLITDKRVIMRAGWLSYAYVSVFYQNIVDLHMYAGIIDHSCGSGTISMTQLGHMGEHHIMTNVPNCPNAFKVIQEAMKNVKADDRFDSVF